MTATPGPLAAVAEMWRGQFVRLQPVMPGDLSYLFELASRREVDFRWLGGEVGGSPREFAGVLQQALLAGFLVIELATGRPVGFVGIYEPDLLHATAKLAMVMDHREPGATLTWQGAILLTEYAFVTWRLRRIYVEVVEGASSVPIDIARMIGEEEGRLKDHIFYNGGFCDLSIFAITAEQWDAVGEELLDSIQPLEVESVG
ncbi:MAG: hypothetical protein QOE92_1762 [Chloroflexota bacterium]|jgi:RimJ/RimL family protein N-acetyltransferase|nr:hypothetical protein [Chloroflexota bacterium]